MNTLPESSTPARKKAVVAAAIGNFVEWFEYITYGIFAATIAAIFFPIDDGSVSLLAAFAVFGVSFVVRPLGALAFGHFGDKLGRRTTLAVAILGMSVSTFAIGILPSYASVGILAPILLVIARMLQGFSAGGEFGGSTAFMIEYAPTNRRALYGSWQFFTMFLAGLAATLVGTVLTAALSAQALTAWGWRVPFLLTLPLGLIGLYLRLRLDETPQFQQVEGESAARKAPLLEALRDHWRNLLKICGIVIMGTTITYMLAVFLPAFLVKTVGIPQVEVFTALLISISLKIVLVPVFALLSDRLGRRRPFLIATPLGIALFAVPAYSLLLQGTFATTVLGYIILTVLLAPMNGSLAAAMADTFPPRVRYSGLSIGYSAAVSIFGGFTPLILTALVQGTASKISPGFYLAGTAVVTLVAAILLGENGNTARTRRAAAAKDKAHSEQQV